MLAGTSAGMSAGVLPALALLIGAIALIAHALRSRRSIAARIADAVRGASPSRPRASLGWAAGIAGMYGATSLVALALIGRVEAVAVLPPELHGAFGILPLDGVALRETALAIGGGFLLGAGLLAVSLWRKWRVIGPTYRSPAIARTRQETGAAFVLAVTAGVAEEMFFRLTVPLLAAIVTGSAAIGCVLGWALFTLAHRYQGRGGMIAVGLVGAGLGWLYLSTGLLWAAMLLHAVVDVNALIVRPWLERRFGRGR
ncbi:CPBP family intramembrane glutamic endopeptidase [Sphingomonas panaciterrae]|uniref:CPBP family intramembrane glutamic endopeptidase n=1 Tax=Sphingomonas panaciterrae TaxID=1462999 RepID=UPI002FEE78F9